MVFCCPFSRSLFHSKRSLYCATAPGGDFIGPGSFRRGCRPIGHSHVCRLGPLSGVRGPLSDSFDAVLVAIAGLVVLFASVTASAFAPNIEVFLALRILTGLGGGTLPPNAIGAISDVISPEKRAQAVGALLAISLLTTAISVPMVALLAEWTSWRFTFVLSGVLLGAGLVTNWLWFPKDKGERVRDLVIFSRYWSLLSLQFFRVALTVNLSHRIAYWAIVIFFAAFLIETYDVSVGFVAMPLAIAATGQVVGSYGGGFVANRGIGPRHPPPSPPQAASAGFCSSPHH